MRLFMLCFFACTPCSHATAWNIYSSIFNQLRMWKVRYSAIYSSWKMLVDRLIFEAMCLLICCWSTSRHAYCERQNHNCVCTLNQTPYHVYPVLPTKPCLVKLLFKNRVWCVGILLKQQLQTGSLHRNLRIAGAEQLAQKRLRSNVSDRFHRKN